MPPPPKKRRLILPTNPPLRPTRSPIYLPIELWEYILGYVNGWRDAKALADTCWGLRVKLQQYDIFQLCQLARLPWRMQTLNLLKYCGSRWITKVSVMMLRCELCRRYTTCHMYPVWNLFTHRECIEKELIGVEHAVTKYGLEWDDVMSLPRHAGQVWKYHGGRVFLAFKMNHTLQGLCLAKYKESLHDRRARIDGYKDVLRLSLS